MAKLTPSQIEAERRIADGRLLLVMQQQFYGVLTLSLKVEPAPPGSFAGQRETMATDGKRLIYGADYVLEQSQRKLIGLLAHEVSHISYLHHVRRGTRDPRLWNVACDYAIDRDLTAAGFDVPDALIDPRFAGMNAEEIYAQLQREGSTQQPKAGGVFEPSSEPSKLEEAAREAESLVRQALAVARAQVSGPGAPADIVRMYAALNAPKVNWRDVLRQFPPSSHVSRDYSFARPNRRHIGRGLILPSLVSIAPCHAVFAFDNSGSMDNAAVTAGLSEGQGMLDERAIDRLTVLACDSAINGTWEYEAGDVIDCQFRGGGGTRFSPVMSWVADNAPDAACLVYFTDMGSHDYGEAPPVPVLWARYGSKSVAPFGEHVDVDGHN